MGVMFSKEFNARAQICMQMLTGSIGRNSFGEIVIRLQPYKNYHEPKTRRNCENGRETRVENGYWRKCENYATQSARFEVTKSLKLTELITLQQRRPKVQFATFLSVIFD